MKFIKLLLWLIAFGAATFCWFVLFEHGFGVESFVSGSKEEFQALLSFLGMGSG